MVRDQARRRLERLSPLATSNLRVENRGLPTRVAALLLLDGTPALESLRW